MNFKRQAAQAFALFPLLQRILQTCILLGYFLFTHNNPPFFAVLGSSTAFSLALADIILQLIMLMIVRKPIEQGYLLIKDFSWIPIA